MVILSPRGRLLHVITGYVAPAELFFELTQALASWKEVKEAALTAELDVQKRELVVRQDVVQKAWREHFGPKGRGAKGAAAKAPRATWQERQAQHDREVVRENALAHAGTITTRMLTGGPGTHFGYGNGGDEDRTKPIINEIRRRIGAPPVRETEADKRVRKRREAARGNKADTPRRSDPTAGRR